MKEDFLVNIEYWPVTLPEDFPVLLDHHYRQSDDDINGLHIHDCMELGYCHAGSGIFVVNNKVMPFTAGDISFVTSEETHRARSSRGTESLWSWVYFDPLRLISAHFADRDILSAQGLTGERFRNIIKSDSHPVLSGLLAQLIEELKIADAGYRPATKGLIWTLLAKLPRLVDQTGHNEVETSAKSKRHAIARIANGLDYLASHYDEVVSIDKLAKICGASPTNLRRIFKQAVGMSPQAYHIHLRVQMATTLLQNTDRSVLDIANQVGYITLSSFNRHFKSRTGMSPREWRCQKPIG